MTLRILAPLAVLTLVAAPAMAASKTPVAKHHHAAKPKKAKTAKPAAPAKAS